MGPITKEVVSIVRNRRGYDFVTDAWVEELLSESSQAYAARKQARALAEERDARATGLRVVGEEERRRILKEHKIFVAKNGFGTKPHKGVVDARTWIPGTARLLFEAQ